MMSSEGSDSALFNFDKFIQQLQPKTKTLARKLKKILIKSVATSPDQSGLGSDGNKGVLRIPQSSRFTDCFVSYLGHSLGESYSSTEMQSVYSPAPVDRVQLATGRIYEACKSYNEILAHIASLDKQ